jgi:hypothetical protein
VWPKYVLLPAPIVLALVLTRGSLRLTVDRWSAGLLGVAMTGLAGSRVVNDLRAELVIAAFATGMTALIRIFRASSSVRWPSMLAAFGCLCNIVPIAVYSAMPVRAEAFAALSPKPINETGMFAAKHVHVSGDAPLTWLGDTIPVPPLRAVFSVGDLLILASFGGLGVSERRRIRRGRSTSASSATGPRRAVPAALTPALQAASSLA